MLERVEAWTRVASVILGNRCFPGTMASLLKRAYQGRKRALNDAPWIVDEMRRYYLAFPEGSVQELST